MIHQTVITHTEAKQQLNIILQIQSGTLEDFKFEREYGVSDQDPDVAQTPRNVMIKWQQLKSW